MAEVGRILGASLDFEATLGRVASLAVPRIADWCAIELLSPDGRLQELALAHADPSKVRIVDELRRAYPADPADSGGSYGVVRDGQSVMVPEVTRELIAATAVDDRQAELVAALDLRSYMCVPLRAGDRVLGALTLATDGSGRHFGPMDLVAAEDLASRAAAAIENARAFASADRFRRILDAVAEAIFVIDPRDGRIRDVNHAATSFLGAERSAVVGRPIWEFAADIGPRKARQLAAPLLDRRLDSRTITARMRGPRNGDEPRPVEVLVQRVDLKGEGPGLVAIARDIRDRVDAQERLERLAEAEHARASELNAVIRAMGDGVVVCGPDGRVTLANPAAHELFPDVVASTYDEILAELVDADDAAPILGWHGGPVTLATRRDPDRWIEVATYPVDPPATGERARRRETIVVLRDVTAARQRDAVRETFIGVLSHELRTPVTTIYGGAKVLARTDSSLDEETRRAIFTDIAEEAERLQRLVEDVVALNRFGEPGGEMGQEPVLLQRVVPAVVRSERSRWPGVTFVEAVPAGLPTVAADPTYVEQVVRNLLSNAAKYGGQGSTVSVVLEHQDGEVALRILDDGPGVEPDETERVFELFYRSPATAGATSGAGIGLFVCARLVAAMGGRIWARPRPDGGSEFGFALRVMTGD
jgi:PAS domain S-box-containing protein